VNIPVTDVETFHGTSLHLNSYLVSATPYFQSYKLHLSPLLACGEGVGGGVLVPGLMTICCKCIDGRIRVLDSKLPFPRNAYVCLLKSCLLFSSFLVQSPVSRVRQIEEICFFCQNIVSDAPYKG
jgi:hypothetical protein